MNALTQFKCWLLLLVWLALPVYGVTLNKGFTPAAVVSTGDSSLLTITVSNDQVFSLNNVSWTDNLPAGMTILASPAPTNNCGGSLTATAGTALISLTGGVVPAKVGAVFGQCSVVVSVITTVQGNTINTIAANNMTNTEGFSNTSQAQATIFVPSFAEPTLNTTLNPSTVYIGQTATLTVSVTNNDGIGSLTQTGWNYVLPTGLQVNGTVTNNGNCGSPTMTGVIGTTTIALANATIVKGATCTLTIPLAGTVTGNYTITLPAGVITSYQGATNASPSSQAIAVQSFSVGTAFSVSPVRTNQVSVLSVTISSVAAYTSLAFTDDFSSQTGLVVAPVPGAAITGTGCSGSVTAVAGSSSIALSGGSIPAGSYVTPAVCTISVNVVVPLNANAGVKTHTLAAGSVTGLSSGISASNINAASASLTVNGYVAPTLTKTFGTDPIFVGQNSLLTINLKNNDSASFTSLGWTDTLPTGLVANATAAKNAACSGGSVTGSAGATAISLSGVTVAAGATCTVTVNVTATGQGTGFINDMPIGAVSDAQGTGNTAAASVTLSTANTITAAMTFNGLASTSIAANVPAKLRITISNQSTHAYGSLAFSNNWAATIPNLVIAATPNAISTCNAASTPTVTATAGTKVLGLSGGTIAAGAFGAAASCYVEVDVISASAFSSLSNTLALGAVTATDSSNSSSASSYQAASASVAVIATAAPTLTKSFSASPVYVGQSFNALIAVKNNDATLALTNVAWTDTLPTGLKVNGAANKSAGCTGTSTILAPLNGNSIAFSAGTIAAGATCTVTVPVVATQENQSPGLVNSMAGGSVTNDQGVSDSTLRSATVVTRTINGSKAFSSATVHPNMPVTLTITLSNYSTDSYNNLAFSDVLSAVNANLKVATTPNASTTCNYSTTPTFSPAAADSTITFSNGSIGPGTAGTPSTCTVKVDVQSSQTFASAANTIAAGAITATAVSDGSAAKSYALATANLAVIAIANPTLTKNFSANPVYVGQTSTLSISVNNTDTLIPLTGVKWTDTLPANLTMVTSPVANAACGSPSLTVSGQVITFGATTGGTIAVGATCTVTVDVTADRQSLGTNFLNSMAANAVITDQLTTSALASATLSVETLKIVKTLSGSTGTITDNINNPLKLRITLNNYSTHAYSSIAFTDNFGVSPSTLLATFTIVPVPTYASTNLVSTCTGSVTATQGTRIVSLTGGSLAAGTSGSPTSCYIEVDVVGTATFNNLVNGIPATNSSCVGSGALTATDNVNSTAACDKTGSSVTLTLGSVSSPRVAKSFATTPIYVGQPSVLTITIQNRDTTATLTNVHLPDTLPTGLVVATGTVSNSGCGTPTITATAGTTLIDLAAASIGPTPSNAAPWTTCTLTVPVTGTKAGSYTNTIAASALTDAQSVTDTTQRSNSPALVVQSGLSVSKAFSSPIVTGGISTLTLTVSNRNTSAYTGLSVTDDLSTMTVGGGVYIAPTPNFFTDCGSGSISYPTTQKFVFSGGSIGAASVYTTPVTCTIRVDVQGTISGTSKVNTILAGALTVTEDAGQTNAAVTGNLTVNVSQPTLAKTFSVASIKNNGTDVSTMRITVTNPNTLVALSNIDVTDTFGAALSGLVIYSTPAAVNTCNGSLTATAGTNTLHLSGGTVAASGSCYVEVPVVSTLKFSSSNNTASLNSASTPYQALTGFPVTTTAPIAATDVLTATNSFASSSILDGTKTRLTITITSDSAVAKTGLAFSDTLPSRINVAAPVNLSNSCGGTVTTTATTVTLAGGSIAANVGGVAASCTISLDVVGISNGAAQTNTISNIVSTQTPTSISTNAASITVTAATITYGTLTKTYSVSPVSLGQNTRVTIGWKQSLGASSVNPAVTDNLPRGLRVADTPNASATCSVAPLSPAVSVTVNSNSYSRDQIVITLTHTQALNETCSVSFDATGAYPGAFTNTIAVGDIYSSTSNAVNTTAVSATSLTVNNIMTISKAFQPTTLGPGGVSTLKITLTNPEVLALTGVSFTDTLPAGPPGLLIASPANATTDCTATGVPDASKVTATPGGSSIVLSGGIVPAKAGSVNGVCTVTVSVKPAGVYSSGTATNTIAIGALTSNEGRSNASPAASDTITFTPAPSLSITKDFSPLQVTGGSVSRLTLTITNPATFTQSGLAFTDVMPAGMTIGAPPNPSTTCTGGTFSGATTDSGTWSFSGGSVSGNNGTCTVSVNVTSNVDSNLTNTIAAGGLTSINGGTNAQLTSASLSNLPGVSVNKSFTPTPVVVNQAVRLLIVLTNSSNSTSLSQLAFNDDLTVSGSQSGLTVSATPNLTNSCNGTVTLATTSIKLAGGTLAKQSSCQIGVDMVTNTAGSYTNVIPANALTSLETFSNGVSGTDTLPVYAGIKAVKQLSPVSDAGKFVLTLSPAAPTGVSSRTNVGHDATPSAVASFFVTAGTAYTVTETGQGATSLANYISTYECRNADNTLLVSGSGSVTSAITPPTTISGATKNQQDITCTFTNISRPPLLTVYTLSNGDTGSFGFSGSNGIPGGTITTTTAGVSATTATLTEISLTAKNVATTLTQSSIAADFVLSGAACTGLQGSDSAALVGSTLTIPATSIIDGARIVCTFTDTRIFVDHGDAPAAYGDASHTVPASPAVYLGNVPPDADTAANVALWQAQTGANGDDGTGSADEGIAQLLASGASSFPVLTASPGSYSLTLRCAGTTTANAISGWIDFNRNNTFDSAERAQGTCSSLTNGTVTLTWNTFTGINPGLTYARFRIASNAAESASPTSVSSAADGEVEDYAITIAQGTSLTVSKASSGGVGTFTFTGTNGWTSQDITTVSSGVTVTGTTQYLTLSGVSTDLGETPLAGYRLSGINCTGLGAGGAVSYDLPNRKATLNAAATVAGSAISCAFSNTQTNSSTVTVTNISNGGTGTFSFTGTNGWVSQDISTVSSGVGV